MRGGHNRKVTPAQREELLALYLSGDIEGARAHAVSLGLHRDYAASRASEFHHKPVKRPVPTQHRWV